jgi:hypothetical protein
MIHLIRKPFAREDGVEYQIRCKKIMFRTMTGLLPIALFEQTGGITAPSPYYAAIQVDDHPHKLPLQFNVWMTIPVRHHFTLWMPFDPCLNESLEILWTDDLNDDIGPVTPVLGYRMIYNVPIVLAPAAGAILEVPYYPPVVISYPYREMDLRPVRSMLIELGGVNPAVDIFTFGVYSDQGLTNPVNIFDQTCVMPYAVRPWSRLSGPLPGVAGSIRALDEIWRPYQFILTNAGLNPITWSSFDAIARTL